MHQLLETPSDESRGPQQVFSKFYFDYPHARGGPTRGRPAFGLVIPVENMGSNAFHAKSGSTVSTIWASWRLFGGAPVSNSCWLTSAVPTRAV